MKRQDLLYRRAHAVVDLEGDAGLRAQLAPLQFQPELQKEQLFEDQPDVRRGARLLQVHQALADLGPVRLPEGLAPLDQPHAPANRRGNGVGDFRLQVLQHAVDDAAKPARGQPSVAGAFVDGHHAPDFQRLPLVLLAAFAHGGIVQNLELRLDNLEAVALAALGNFHLAVERQQHAGAKFVAQVAAVEPQALQGVAALAHGHLKDGHAAGAKQAEGAHLGDDAGHLARAQLADAARVQPVFIAKRQVVEQVFNGGDALVQQHLGKVRPNAFDVLDVGGELEHIAMVNERGGS